MPTCHPVSRQRDRKGGAPLRRLRGLTLVDGLLELIDCTLSGHSAGDDGGGIDSLATLTLQRSTLVGNSSTDNGGGLHSKGDLVTENSTFSGNLAGGALYNAGGDAVGALCERMPITLLDAHGGLS